MQKKTVQRLSEVIRRRASECILFELKDPRLGFMTVTRVELAPDLSSCRIYYSVLGTPKERNRTRHALHDARGYVQHVVAKSLQTRVAPHVEFEYDESIEGAARMQSLLKELRDSRDETPPDAPLEEPSPGSPDSAAGAADERLDPGSV